MLDSFSGSFWIDRLQVERTGPLMRNCVEFISNAIFADYFTL